MVEQLPDDIEALKAIAATALQDVARKEEQLQAQMQTIAHLQHEVTRLSKLVFAPKSERRRYGLDDPKQGFLFCALIVAEAEQVANDTGACGEIEIRAPKRRKAARRSTFPDHLPTVTTTYELPADQRTCPCGGVRHEIGHEVTRELERVEMTIVHVIQRTKYGCRACEAAPVTAPGPDRVIDKGILGPGFLAHVQVERFGNHMPYHRLEKKYAAEGLDLSRTVLQRSTARCAEMLAPVWEQMRRDVLASPVIWTDDTSVRLVQPTTAADRPRNGRIWVYLDGEGRHWYDFTHTRERDGPQRALGDYRGFIQADAYAGYDRLYLPGGATEVGCWAHARRKFVDIENLDPGVARQAIALIRELYAIERAAGDRELEPAAVHALRQQRAVPVLGRIHDFLHATKAATLPKSPTAQAVNYSLNQWQALNRYVTDGRLSIDNNAAERALRAVAVGRKNWLFFQEDTGGRTAAVILSLLMTAKAIGLVPVVYFRDLLTRIGRCHDVTRLTPHGWKLHFAEQVERDRVDLLERLAGKG